MRIVYFYLVLLMILFCTLVVGSLKAFKEPFISPLAGPVDMLQSPKRLLIDGYRFQNSMFSPEEANLRQPSDLCPSDRQRVGVFKDKAYVLEGFESPGAGALLQVSARGDQDQYLLGKKGDPIADNINLLGSPYAQLAPPGAQREVNYPNQAFSWGDILHRYHDHLDDISFSISNSRS